MPFVTIPLDIPTSIRKDLPFELKVDKLSNKKTPRFKDESEGDLRRQLGDESGSGLILEPKEQKIRDLLRELQHVSFLSF